MNYEDNDLLEKQPETPPQTEAEGEEKKVKIGWAGLAGTAACITLQAVTLIVMLFGSVNVYGAGLNPVSVINNVIGVFSITQGTVYIVLSKLAVSVFYIFAVAVMIKNVIASIGCCTAVFSKQTQQKTDAGVKNLYSRSVSTAIKYFALAIVGFLFTSDDISAGTVTVIVFACITYIGVSCVNVCKKYLPLAKDKNAIIDFVFELAKPLLLTALSLMLAAFILIPSVYNLNYGVQVVFGGYSGDTAESVIRSFLEYIVQDILFVVAAVIYAKLVAAVIRGVRFDDTGVAPVKKSGKNYITKQAVKLLVIVGLSALLTCIASSLNLSSAQAVDASVIGSWLNLLRMRFLPGIAVLAAVIVSANGAFESSAANSPHTVSAA